MPVMARTVRPRYMKAATMKKVNGCLVTVTPICAWRMISSRPITDTSAVSFIRIMNRLPRPGKAMRHICGMIRRVKMRNFDSPNATPASRWPLGMARIAPRNTSVA